MHYYVSWLMTKFVGSSSKVKVLPFNFVVLIFQNLWKSKWCLLGSGPAVYLGTLTPVQYGIRVRNPPANCKQERERWALCAAEHTSPLWSCKVKRWLVTLHYFSLSKGNCFISANSLQHRRWPQHSEMSCSWSSDGRFNIRNRNCIHSPYYIKE